MKILIDARFYGLENAGIGRYTMNLVNELQKIDTGNNYIILLRKKYFDELNLPKNWEKVKADIRHYSFEEQIKLPRIIKKYNPDLTHFLNSNVPVNFKGNFVVTIHDLTMYKTNMKATTLSIPIYYAKNLVYKKVLEFAVKKSQKIIVPSKFVKDELVKNFKILEEKVRVTYEGV